MTTKPLKTFVVFYDSAVGRTGILKWFKQMEAVRGLNQMLSLGPTGCHTQSFSDFIFSEMLLNMFMGFVPASLNYS